jgi:hypothetical protein
MLLKVPTAGLLDVATALAATDPVARGFARKGLESKVAEQRSFMDVIGEFLQDIVIRIKE